MILAELDRSRKYSYADYYSWQFEERVELIKGQIFKMDATTWTVHQKISGEISAQIWKYLKGKSWAVYSAPFDVRFPFKSKEDKDILTVLQPDICVVCDQSKLDDRGCIGAPDIVVEILSPGNNAKELKNKYEVYEESGVKEYWVVSPQDYTFIIYTLINGKYDASKLMVAGDVVTSSVLEGFSLNLTELFENINNG